MDAAGSGPSQNRRPLIRECKEDLVGRSFGAGGFAKRPSDAEKKMFFQEPGRGDRVGGGSDKQQHQQGLRTLPFQNVPPQQHELQFQQQQQQLSHCGTGLNPQTPAVQSGAANAADYRDLASHLSNTPGDGLATTSAYTPGGEGGGGAFGTMGQNFMTGTALDSATARAWGPTPETNICQGGIGGGERESGIPKASNHGEGQALTCGRMDLGVNFGQAHGGVGGNMMGTGSSISGNMAVAGSGGFGGNMLGTSGDMGTTGGGISATGLLKGNDLLQPSPFTNRKHQQQGQQQQQQQQPYQPQISNPRPSHSVEEYQVATTMMHQQQQCLQSTQQRHRMERLKQMKEEGMSMRQYESPTDQSTMSAESMTMVNMSKDAPGRVGALFGDSPRGQVMIQDRSGEYSSSGQLQQHSRNEQIQQNQDSSSIAPLLQEYPFSFGNFAAWVCPYCQHVPPHYRGGNYMWQASTPPPRQFVESHLRSCPGLNPENMPVEANQHPQQHQQHQQGAQQSSCLGMQGQTVMHQHQHQQVQQAQNPFILQPQQQQMQQAQNPFILQPQQQQMQQAQNPFILQSQQQLSQQGSSDLPNEMVQKKQGAPDPPGMTIPQPSWSSTMQDQSGAIIGQGRFQGNIVPSVQSVAAEQSQGVSWVDPGGAIKSNQPFPYHPSYPHAMHQPLSSAFSQHPHQMFPQVAGGTLAMPPSTVFSNMSRRKNARSKIAPKGHQTDDVTYKAAVDFLTKKTIDMARPAAESLRSDVGQSLVDRSDANLLTDYFFHMMQQLVVCRFSEKDRKTRGGKRKDINIGYGGLQCIHCIETPSSRKFFWSTVDRLSNSFAEIPCHILNCAHCPDDAKEALLALKGRHSDQMQMLPRGSQKVFFRRMWRRLHDGDSEAGERMVTSAGERQTSFTSEGGKGREPSPSESRPRSSAAAAEALKSPYIATPTIAEALVKSMEPEDEGSQEGEMVPEEREHVLLAIPEDKDWLSDTDCFVRNNIEVFSSNQSDVTNAAAEKKRMYPIKVRQVGIRCLHCAKAGGNVRGTAVSYPHSISDICESVKEFQRVHLENCDNAPQDLRNASHKHGSGTASLSSVLKKYYVQAARALGLFDTQDGIRAGGEPVPVSMAGFQTPGGKGNGGASPFTSTVESMVLTPTTTTELAKPKEPPGSDAGTIVAEMSLKRKAPSMDGQPLKVNPWLPTPGALGANQSELSIEPETKRAKSKIDAPGKNRSANKMNAIDTHDTPEKIRPQYPCIERRCNGSLPRGRCISLSPSASKMHRGGV